MKNFILLSLAVLICFLNQACSKDANSSSQKKNRVDGCDDNVSVITKYLVTSTNSYKNLVTFVETGTVLKKDSTVCDAQKIVDIQSLSTLHFLELLSLRGTKIDNLSGITVFEKLKWLDLSNTRIEEISELASQTQLEELLLSGTAIRSIEALSNLVKLKNLDMSDTKVSSFRGLSKEHRNLKYLDASMTDVASVNEVSELNNLEHLYLHDTKIVNISGLSKLESLRFLTLSSTDVMDISPLKNLKNLKMLSIEETLVSQKSVDELQDVNPQLEIHFVPRLEQKSGQN